MNRETDYRDRPGNFSQGFVVKSEEAPLYRVNPTRRRRILGTLGRAAGFIWRHTCFKTIIITLLALLCGFFIGAIYTVSVFVEEDRDVYDPGRVMETAIQPRSLSGRGVMVMAPVPGLVSTSISQP